MKLTRRTFFTTATRLSPLAWLTGAVRGAGTALRYPTVHVLGADEVAVMWSTSSGGSPSLVYSRQPDLREGVAVQGSTTGLSVVATGLDEPLFVHRADIGGLAAGARYYYRTFIDDRESPAIGTAAATFQAPPASGGFRFLVFGDSGTGSDEQKQVAARMAAEQNVSLVVHTGDVVYDWGSYPHYQQKYFDIYRTQLLRVPFALCLGNHDVQEDLGRSCVTLNAFPRVTPPPPWGAYYSFDWGDVHFVCLESNFFGRVEAEPMYEWFDEDLARTKKTWKVVFFHHPPYDALRGEEINSRAARDRVVPLLDKHEVNLVLCGHHHGYVRMHPLSRGTRVEPARGVAYLTTGGGGAGIHGEAAMELAAVTRSVHHHLRVDVQPGRIEVRAIAANGTEFDRLVVARPPALASRALVNAATFEVAVAAGSVVSLFGQHLAPGIEIAGRGALPTELAGVRVTVGGEPLPLFFVSPTQLNAQLPFGRTGSMKLRVTTPYGNSSEADVMIHDAAPGVFLIGGQVQTPAIARADGSSISPTVRVTQNEVLSIYATGLGKLKRSLSAGQIAPASPLYEVESSVTVYFDATPVEPMFAGLAPGFAGMYQVNVRVPSTAGAGVRTLWILTGGVASNIVQVTVA